ncbi:hypothetical protein HYALB_00004519 [Hymenoscyphus albidus]|uniref:Extracellular serine-rich protein n=1 Tax=Hymenoscyphus albidus TaxID=595503 RepID=A0A9N9M086_9HELO|nr:hypothetical protein HYALB_00004519 [Hymenoscyphus albidus]
MKLLHSLPQALINALLVASTVQGHGNHHHHAKRAAKVDNSTKAEVHNELVNSQNYEVGQKLAAESKIKPLANVNGTNQKANTTTATPPGVKTKKITGLLERVISDLKEGPLADAGKTNLGKRATVTANTVNSTVLVIARDDPPTAAYQATSALNGYGIPYQVLIVPKGTAPGGTSLPQLNSSTTAGNFGAIYVISEVSYDYNGNYQSALLPTQWDTMYAYQLNFGVRMVRMDVYPGSTVGATVVNPSSPGCCNDEQLVSITNNTGFPTAGLKLNAGMSTLGLYHYPATVTDPTIATPFLQFAAGAGFNSPSTGGVINNINGRQQMVFFISSGAEFQATSALLNHAWIHWATRGLYAGYRRINFNTQKGVVDDMFLQTEIYNETAIALGVDSPTNFRVRTADLVNHVSWTPKIQAAMPKGSTYFIEIAHNGNGNIDVGTQLDYNRDAEKCGIGAIYLDYGDTPLEFQKPLGTGTNRWPSTPSTYPYSVACTNDDTLKTWFATAANRDVFAHMSHTFTHENQNNATYFDIFREITWNQAWLNQTTLSKAKKFSYHGLVPPAITGLHNGDALRAWSVNGITSCVGDNTRSVLVNKQNEHWPYITNVADNGFAGMVVNPRWALSIYYNCDVPQCTTDEWVKYSKGSGDFYSLLDYEKRTNIRRLMGLHHDGFMFHQANMRQTDAPKTTINGTTDRYSLLQAWVGTVVAEYTRLVNWPMITLKHDDMSQGFINRMTRDLCSPKMSHTVSGGKITAVTVTANKNSCSQPVPVTVPGSIQNSGLYRTEQIGNDPLTVWVPLSGKAVTLTLLAPIAL